MNNYHNTSSVTDMIDTLQWPTLAEHRLKTRLCIFYKIPGSPMPHCRTSHPHPALFLQIQELDTATHKHTDIFRLLKIPNCHLDFTPSTDSTVLIH